MQTVRDYLGISLEEQKEWKDSEDALKKWREVIESFGIFVFKNAFKQTEFSGFCLYDSEFPIIYLNNTVAKTRQIFTLFHELAHLLFKTGGIDKIVDDYIERLPHSQRRVEVFCNHFAAEFLVPDDDFNRVLPSSFKLDESFISALADKYAVSREVILRKLLDRQLVDPEYYAEKAAKWAKDAKTRRSDGGGNYYATQIAYLGNRYLDLVFSEYYRNRISTNQLADYLNVKVSNLPTLETTWQIRRGL